jgi:GNAT superfamily N-acetyltransferase
METLEVYQSRCSDKNEKVAQATEKNYKKAIDQHFTFHPFEGEEFLLKNLEALFTLSLKGFSQNYLYEPISFPEFQALYVPLFKKFDFSTGHLVKNNKGEPVAFCFSFRDGQNLIVKSIVVDPAYQGRGLSNALLHVCSKTAVEQGLIDFIGALFKQVSISGNNLSVKSEVLWEHEYHLFSKKI